MVVVCPWHQYDFSLRTGESATGLQSCVYGVHLRPGADGEEHLFIDPPTGEADPREVLHSAWELVDVRAVSEGVYPATCRPADRRLRQAARCAGAQAGAGRSAGIAGRHVRPRGRAAAVAGAHHARRLGRARAQHAVARAQGRLYAACGACVPQRRLPRCGRRALAPRGRRVDLGPERRGAAARAPAAAREREAGGAGARGQARQGRHGKEPHCPAPLARQHRAVGDRPRLGHYCAGAAPVCQPAAHRAGRRRGARVPPGAVLCRLCQGRAGRGQALYAAAAPAARARQLLWRPPGAPRPLAVGPRDVRGPACPALDHPPGPRGPRPGRKPGHHQEVRERGRSTLRRGTSLPRYLGIG